MYSNCYFDQPHPFSDLFFPFFFYPHSLYPYPSPIQYFPLPSHENLELAPEPEKQTFEEKLRKRLESRRPSFMRKVWTSEEDALLTELGGMNLTWVEICKHFPKSNPQICRRRYDKLLEKDEKWKKEEDELIVSMREKYNSSWASISKSIKNKSSKQIKQRYQNYLRKGISLQEWSIEEDLEIVNFVRSHGTRWKKLSQKMPHRTEVQLKNRYNSNLHLIQQQIEQEQQIRSQIDSQQRII